MPSKMITNPNLIKRFKARTKNLFYQVTDNTNTTRYVPYLITRYHGNPSAKLKLIGITGTNGKSTTGYILSQALKCLSGKTGFIGTVNVFIGNKESQTSLTTPRPSQLNRYLSEMVKENCEYCVMEVSSIGLEEHRVNGLAFAAAVFTNLTQDHLDFHHTFEEYCNAKSKLFTSLPASSVAIVNHDDKHYQSILKNSCANIISYGKSNHLNTPSNLSVHFKVIRNDINGLELEIDEYNHKFHLIGEFNAYNIAAAYTTLKSFGFKPQDILKALSHAKPPTGRLQILNPGRQDGQPLVIVDYAHTPDAMEKLLTTVRSISSEEHRINIVFGCGGGRDKGKRPKMGAIAEELADFTIVTSANSRYEDTQSICNDICSGFKRKDSYAIEKDRKAAIQIAINRSGQNSIVIISGLGHKKYQEINGNKYYHSDQECALAILNQSI